VANDQNSDRTAAGSEAAPWPSTQRSDAAPSGSSGDSSGEERLPVGTRLHEFEITGFVGEGGFSIVYLAWDHSLERKVALKEYMPSSLAARRGGSRVHARSDRHRDTFETGLKSFVNEGKLLAQFDHPALVKVYRFWEANGTAYMVMPFYEGTTLKDTVRARSEPPDETWLRALLDPLTEALAVLHREQCFHRDIAPDNVLLLAPAGKPLLLDFGAARRVIGDKTQALTVILKPGYAPVEQYAEDTAMKQGPWTDVYALAAVVYWSITGKTPPVSVGRMLSDAFVPLAQCAAGRYSERFVSAVDRALAVLPEQRTPSVAQFRRELGLGGEAAPAADERTIVWTDPQATVVRAPPRVTAPVGPTVGAPAAAPTAPPVSPPSPAKPTLPRVAVGGALAAVAVAAVAWWLLRTPSPPPTVASTPLSPAPQTPMPAPAPAPAPPPQAAPSPAPAPVTVALDRLIAQRDASFDLAAAAQTRRDGLRIEWRSAFEGHPHVLAVRPGADRLDVLHPTAAAAQRGSGSRSGTIDVTGATLEPGTSLLLVVSRERRDLRGAGWTPRDGVLSRTLAAGDASDLLGAPRCATDTPRCDGAYGVTEVTPMTNVTTAPDPTPSTRPSAPPTPAQTPAVAPPVATPAQRPLPEGKTATRRPSATSAECAQILQRVSLGESSPELIERMKTLRCG
jgi:serine/threonine protein kinase